MKLVSAYTLIPFMATFNPEDGEEHVTLHGHIDLANNRVYFDSDKEGQYAELEKVVLDHFRPQVNIEAPILSPEIRQQIAKARSGQLAGQYHGNSSFQDFRKKQ